MTSSTSSLMACQLRKHRPTGFTLIEVLVVLTIISVLTSLAVLGLGGNRAAKLSADGNAVADLVGLAQQNALGKNAPTALVFAQTVDGAQAFSLYELDTTATPLWKQVTMWKFLANGVAIDTTSAANTFLTSPTVTPSITTATIPTIGGKAVSTLGYQVFLPSSQIVTLSTTPPRIHLVEGTSQGGTITSQSLANSYDILINPITARAIVERP